MRTRTMLYQDTHYTDPPSKWNFKWWSKICCWCFED